MLPKERPGAEIENVVNQQQANPQYSSMAMAPQYVPAGDYHPAEQFPASSQPKSGGGMIWGVLVVLMLVFLGICGIGMVAALFDTTSSSPEMYDDSMWDSPEYVEPDFDDPAFFEDPAIFDPGYSDRGFDVPYNGYEDVKSDGLDGKF